MPKKEVGIDKTGILCDNKYMGIVHITKEELLDLIANHKPMAEGGYGEIFKLDNSTLFKYYYEKFITLYGRRKELVDTLVRLLNKKLEKYRDDYEILQHAIHEDLPFVDRSDALPDQFRQYQLYTKYKVMETQDKVKRASIPKDLVFVDGALVGTVLNYEKGVSLRNILPDIGKKDNQAKRTLEENMYDAHVELMAHNIHAQDINRNNFIINPNTLDVKAIDLDDVCTEYYGKAPQYLIDQARRKVLKSLDMLFGFEIEKQIDFKFKR